MNQWWRVHRLGMVLLSCGLSACALQPLPEDQRAPVEERPGAVHGPGAPPSSPTEAAPKAPQRTPQSGEAAAYGPLLARAGAAVERGDFAAALALLERAQRIDPDSPAVYLAIARTHAARGDHDRARATAERGLLYCRDPAQCDALRGYTP